MKQVERKTCRLCSQKFPFCGCWSVWLQAAPWVDDADDKALGTSYGAAVAGTCCNKAVGDEELLWEAWALTSCAEEVGAVVALFSHQRAVEQDQVQDRAEAADSDETAATSWDC
jgi:hypothetical protein